MPRNISTAFLQALTGSNLYPSIFLMVTMATGPVYAWSGYNPITWNGIVWTGVGSMLDISTIEDGSSVAARGVSVSLSGIDPTVLPLVLNEFQVGLPAVIWLALANGEGGQLISSPVIAWSGRTDQPTISVDASTATITLALESILLDMNTPISLRYTQQDQTRFFPQDTGMAWVNSIAQIPIYWGGKATSQGQP